MPRIFKDQMGRTVEVPEQLRRIISLVPSQTELLSDLGLDSEVVGITKFCIHPDEWFRTKTRVGGTKKLNLEVIRSLEPDLILGNKEENSRSDIEWLAAGYPVWMSDISTLDNALEMIAAVSSLVNKEKEGLRMAEDIADAFDRQLHPSSKPLKALYLIWYNPWMGAGSGTLIDDMLKRCGFQNVLDSHRRYPELSPEVLATLNPEVVLLSSEPFPFKDKHSDAIRTFFPSAKVLLVDGEMFSWYGSRLLKSPAYFAQLCASVALW